MNQDDQPLPGICIEMLNLQLKITPRDPTPQEQIGGATKSSDYHFKGTKKLQI